MSSNDSGGLTRREFLQTAALTVGTAGLTLTKSSASDRRCLLLLLTGGPSHIDTFDPKPDAPAEYRGPFRSIPTTIPGVRFTELFPRLAARANRLAIVRSLNHTAAPVHETGRQLLLAGLPSPGAMPTALRGHVSESMPTQSRGHGTRHYGDTPFGQECSRALRRIESGSQFVSVEMFPCLHDAVTWDCHADGGSLNTTLADYRAHVAPMFDWAFSALLDDLADRGLLDSTLVLAVGEFGRSPRVNLRGGRDHWPGVWSALIAGGGTRGGQVIGASDRFGGEPAACPVTPANLVATIHHALGRGPETQLWRWLT